MELGRNETTERQRHIASFASKDAAKELELRMARFAITVRKMCSEAEIDSGVGRVIKEHLLHYSAAAKDNARSAFGSKSKTKRRQLLDESRQQVYMVLHWLGQLDSSGDLVTQAARTCQVSGTGIAMDLSAMLGEGGGQALRSETKGELDELRDRQLSDI